MDIKSDEELDVLRDQSFLSGLSAGNKVFNGVTLAAKFETIQKQIDEMEVYDDDTWITSFPKCGTTWAQEMIWCICKKMDSKGFEESIHLRYPFVEFSCLPENSIRNVDSLELVKNTKRPRFIKTHLSWELLPKRIRTFEIRPKIIHIVREPKDACVSYYYHSRLISGYAGDFHLFCQLFLKHKLIWTPFITTVLGYWNRRNEPNVHLLKYEDMQRNLSLVVHETAKFLNVELFNDDIPNLLRHLSFDSMKNNSSLNRKTFTDTLKTKNLTVDEPGEFMRKGVVGDYKTMMSTDIIDSFDREITSVLNEAGLKF